MTITLGLGFTLRVQGSAQEGPESPRESPWVSLGSQRSYILRFPEVLGPLGQGRPLQVFVGSGVRGCAQLFLWSFWVSKRFRLPGGVIQSSRLRCTFHFVRMPDQFSQ